jgi:uncharacterized membrane protein (DUF4010 family)
VIDSPGETTAHWPYLPTLIRLGLGLAVGLFVGIERERRRKEAGLRTFSFVALLGCVGGLLGGAFALLALGLVGVLVVLLNVETIRTGEGAEITTSAALLVVAFAGMLAGEGHTFTPTTLAIVTAGLLAWKEPLAGFSQTLTESELRSAVLLAILSFVVYPVLPEGTFDPWGLVHPREAWLTVVLIAALGFVNYILLKRYGARGIELTGFLGGLINSTVTVAELTVRSGGTPAMRPVVYRGVVLATAAMLLRNAAILGALAPKALAAAGAGIGAMLLISAVLAMRRATTPPLAEGDSVLNRLASPFSLVSALKFGVVFLVLQVGATLAQRALGNVGFYTVSAIGGLVSSASAVASAGALAASGTLPPSVAGTGALIAAACSVLVNVPVVMRLSNDPLLRRRVAIVLVTLSVAGLVVALAQRLVE